MKRTIALILATAAAQAATYNTPPTLLAPRTVNLNLPFGEVPALTAKGVKVESLDTPALWSFGDGSISSFTGGLKFTSAGFVGFTLTALDVTGYPTESAFAVYVAGRYAGNYAPGYFGTDEKGEVLVVPLQPDAYATLTALTVADAAPALKIECKAGAPSVTLTGQPGQAFALWSAESLQGPWTRVRTGNLDATGKAVCECAKGAFFKAE